MFVVFIFNYILLLSFPPFPLLISNELKIFPFYHLQNFFRSFLFVFILIAKRYSKEAQIITIGFGWRINNSNRCFTLKFCQWWIFLLKFMLGLMHSKLILLFSMEWKSVLCLFVKRENLSLTIILLRRDYFSSKRAYLFLSFNYPSYWWLYKTFFQLNLSIDTFCDIIEKVYLILFFI